MIKQIKSVLKTNLQNKNGFTLVELVVVLAIIGLVLGVGFMLLIYNQKTYTAIDTRVDTQTEFRFIINNLEKEIGTAKEINLLNVDTSLPVATGYTLIYVDTVDGKGSLYKKEGSTATPSINPSNIPGLVMEFIHARRNIITVKLESSGGHILQKEIYAQNTNIPGDVNSTTYNVIKIIPVD